MFPPGTHAGAAGTGTIYDGLAGCYEVLMMPKYAGSTSPQSVSIGVNLDALGSGAVGSRRVP